MESECPLLGAIVGKLVVMAPQRLGLHSQAVPVFWAMHLIAAVRGRHTERQRGGASCHSNFLEKQGE
jgi:hypothetical protein